MESVTGHYQRIIIKEKGSFASKVVCSFHLRRLSRVFSSVANIYTNNSFITHDGNKISAEPFHRIYYINIATL